MMRRKNINTSNKRIICFHLYFPSYNNAESAESDLLRMDFTIQSLDRSDNKDWLCLAQKELVPDSNILKSIRRKFEKIAEKYDGLYLGLAYEVTY